jgi:hypothetical protein
MSYTLMGMEELDFELDWEYFFLVLAISLVLAAFFYVGYNTVSGVRESVNRNFNTIKATSPADKVAIANESAPVTPASAAVSFPFGWT